MNCPTCKCQMCWGSDCSFDDIGYEGKGIVSFYECLNCGTSVEVCVPENGINTDNDMIAIYRKDDDVKHQ